MPILCHASSPANINSRIRPPFHSGAALCDQYVNAVPHTGLNICCAECEDVYKRQENILHVQNIDAHAAERDGMWLSSLSLHNPSEAGIIHPLTDTGISPRRPAGFPHIFFLTSAFQGISELFRSQVFLLAEFHISSIRGIHPCSL